MDNRLRLPHCRKHHQTAIMIRAHSPCPGPQIEAVQSAERESPVRNGQVRILGVVCPQTGHVRTPPSTRRRRTMSGPNRGDLEWSPPTADKSAKQVRAELRASQSTSLAYERRMRHANFIRCQRLDRIGFSIRLKRGSESQELS